MKRRLARSVAAAIAALIAGSALTACGASTAATEPPPAAPSAQAQNDTPATTEEEFDFGGLERSYRVTAPADAGDEPLAVLLALHGAGGSAVTLNYITGFDLAAEEDRFLLVEPNGTGPDAGSRTWNAGTCCGSSVGTVDDIGFLSEVLDRVEADYPVDADRVYVAGFSNGGMMAYRAACELGERIAGIAVVAGAMNVDGCPAPRPLPVLVIHGSDDPVVQFEGGASNYGDSRVAPWYNVPVEESVGFWVQRNGCDEAPLESTVDAALVREWSACSVQLWIVRGGKHTWFGGPMSLASGLEPEGSPSATDLTLRFFGLSAG
jgi:polyhydroxybutyrate depolymerase